MMYVCAPVQAFREVPAIFQEAQHRLAPHIEHWGYVPTKVPATAPYVCWRLPAAL